MSRCPGIEPTADDLLTVVGLQRPLPIQWVARMTGVSQAQIRQWKRRGHLAAADEVDQHGRPMYRGIDVLRAQAAAEANAARTQAVSAATRRESVSA